MSIESLTCIEVEVSPIHEEEIVSVGISEEEVNLLEKGLFKAIFLLSQPLFFSV